MDINVKALVIDDSSVMRMMVIKGLTESKLANFEFVEATDGQDALEKMKYHPIDIAFVDWNMPNMTGIEFVTKVRQEEKLNGDAPLPLIMVTSERTIGKMQIALDEAGADHFISKPFTVEELVYKLKKHVDRAVQLRLQKNRAARDSRQTTTSQSGGWFGKLFG